MKNDDAQLIQRTLAGDQAAFSTLVRKYQKPVHALVWRKIGDFHIAEEITQDIFLSVYKKLQTLKNPNRFAGWLYVIAARRCYAWCKKKRIPMKSLDAMSTEELEELAYVQYRAQQEDEGVSERQREVVKRLLRKLPESERTVVTLHYLGGMTCEDISQLLGVSPNTIKSRLHRARQRLKKAEHIVRENLGGFQFPTTLTEKIAQEISRIKSTAPSGGKPWMPWAVVASTTALVVLLMGSGTQYLPRFQKPYSFDAKSEATVELVDTFFVRTSKQKLSVRNQFGNTDTLGKRNGNTNHGTKALQITAEQPEPPDISDIKSQWIPMGGPEGTSGGRAGLFATSKRALYAVAARGIYRLTADEKTWTLICESTPTRQFQTPMAERGDTLYVLTADELLASTDEGKTWDVVGSRPEGRAYALLATDEALYLIFEKHIFRSDDAGKSWIPMTQDLHAYIIKINGAPDNISISDAVALDNTVFVGTNQGLYRLATGLWEKLSLPTRRFDASRGSWYITSLDEYINSLIATEGRLYIVAGSDFTRSANLFEQSRMLNQSTEVLKHPPRIFRSTDLGTTWVDISPVEGLGTDNGLWMELPPTDNDTRLQMFSGIQLVAVGETLVVMGSSALLRSDDCGDTWDNIGTSQNALSQSVFPVVALDENNFYTSDISGIARSTDAGVSWNPFSTGMVNSHVQGLLMLENVLYALTPEGIVKSRNLGETWTFVRINTGDVVLKEQLRKKQKAQNLLSHAKIAKINGALYISSSTEDNVAFFRLSTDQDAMKPVQRMPVFAEDTLQSEWQKRFDAVRNSSPVPNMSEISRLRRTDMSRIIEERRTNGGFTMTGETVFMEFRHKLFRWRKGETQWFNTGIMDITERAPGADTSKGLTLAASQNVVYAGKRDGSLFQSLDSGENWKELTANLPFAFAYFEEIVFAGATVYVVTDQGVMNSHDGINWHVLTDTEGHPVHIVRIAAEGDKVYGISNRGVYRINGTNTWIRMSSEVPYKVTAFAVDRGIFYIGTRHRGVLRLHLNQSNN